MESLSFTRTRRLIKIVALVVVSLGLCLHIYLTYNSLLLAGLVLTAIGVVDTLCISILWPHVSMRTQPSEVHVESRLRTRARA
jgi:hypothetical protein